MRDSGGGAFFLAALILSVAAHMAGMFYFEPQVMTHISGSGARSRARMPARFVKAPPETAGRDDESAPGAAAPAAESPSAADAASADKAPSPERPSGAFSVFAPENETEAGSEAAPPPEAVLLPDANPPLAPAVFDSAPPGSESEGVVVALPGIVPGRERDALEKNGMFTIRASAPAGQSSAAAQPEPPPPAVPLEDIELPAPDSAAGGNRLADSPASSFDSLSPRLSADEILSSLDTSAVMPSLDEKVVEREKDAVRALLDLRDAGPLEKKVSVAARSAKAGDWIYFKVSLSPDESLPIVAKDMVVLFDASGSIANDRLESCREAARQVLRSCMNSGDRFNLVAFRDKFEYAFGQWRDCDAASYDAAEKWMSNLAAHGRTDVFASMASVLKLPRDPARPIVALVITDGDANTGVTATSKIISRFTALNDGLVSLYMYGVKKTANRKLIDVLTHGNRGEGFVHSGDRSQAGSGIESMAERFRDPVLTDLRIVFPAASKAEAYPARLKNLYRGQTLEIYGRAPDGARRIGFSLKGLNGADAYEGFFEVDLATAAFDAALPAEWAAEQKAHAAANR